MNRRDIGRIYKRLFVKFGETTPDHIGFTDDVSTSGIFIKSSYVFQPGTQLTIDLTLPNNMMIRLIGSVMWSKRVPPSLIRYVKKTGMGVVLDQAPDEFHQFIKSLK